MHSIPFVGYSVKVNRLLKISSETLNVPSVNGDVLEVPGVGYIQARLISSHRRDGMIGERKKGEKDDHSLPRSKSLIIHAHGGGFVSQSSKCHLVYLFEWAVQLNVPILSIDYSLAPEAPYPRALQEIFYTYCWALENAEHLGSTAEKIILCGDSAGANLCLATMLKCITMKVRKPDGIFIAYCPVLVAFDPSPSRLLCLMDPLLPFGFMMRCLKAYSNANANEEPQLEDIKQAKAERNEELKRRISLNPEKSNENGESDDDKSDSFEEISCFERHQTDSNLLAHISQASDVASNDTLAGASFLTGTATDNKNSDELNNTIEIVSPIDSIGTATSLEEDSLPITIQKNDQMLKQVEREFDDVDLPPTASHSDDTNSRKKYVEDFIEKYVLDAKTLDDGSIKPYLRKASHTHSEENIIFDISRETLSVQNIQEKVQHVASTLVETVSSTINQITTTNRPIMRNFSCDDATEARMLGDEQVPSTSSSDFIFNVPKDPFLSPLYADDDVLRQFPPIKILSLTLDPCLDDSVFFAKRLRDLRVDITFDILDGLPHGFFNFSRVRKD